MTKVFLDATLGLELREDKFDRTIRLSGLKGGPRSHYGLLDAAVEAAPDIPAERLDALVGFYLVASLAASDMTPSVVGPLRNTVDLVAPSAAGTVLIQARTYEIPRDVEPPRYPRAVVQRFALTDAVGMPSYSHGRSEDLYSKYRAGFLTGALSTPYHGYGRSEDLYSKYRAGFLTGALSMPHHGYGRSEDLYTSFRRAPVKLEEIAPFAAFTELKKWLRLTSAQLAELLGIKRTTPNAWKREGTYPRKETELRLYRLHKYVSDLASGPGSEERLARLRPALPILTKAIYAQAAIPSETFAAAEIDIPFDWRRVNAFQAANKIAMTEDEEGAPLGQEPVTAGGTTEEDDDELDLLY